MKIGLISLVFVLAPFTRAQVYTITDLGPFVPTSTNAWGQVVGDYNGRAYLWTRFDGLNDLGILAGGSFSHAASINDFGAVVGSADGPATLAAFDPGLGAPVQIQCSAFVQPFIWSKTKGMQGLGAAQFYPGGWPSSQPYPCFNYPSFLATDINATSSVIGYTSDYGVDYQWAFRWINTDGMTVFGGSWPPSMAFGINDFGQVVGENSLLRDRPHSTSWKSDITTDLGALGGSASGAFGVNNLGQVVGWSTTCSATWGDCPIVHAVLWAPNGDMTDLGTLPGDVLSTAYKINYFGYVIGSSGNTAVQTDRFQESTLDRFYAAIGPQQVVGRPFIWTQQSGMRDLNGLIPGDSGWVLNSAADINIWGQIVGSGTLNGEPHGFLLTPRRLFD